MKLPAVLIWAAITISPAFAQTLTLIPSCGKSGDKVCITGAGWAEPLPVCRYTFKFDGMTVAPDQQDGLYGPPASSFNVPGGTADGDHTVHVELRLNSPDNLLQQKDAIFKVLANANLASVTTGGAGTNTITITYNAPDKCVTSCKKIVFIQTIRRYVVKTDGTEVVTKATDWLGIPDAAKKAGVETATNRMRVDMDWGLKAPYYNQGDNGMVPAVGMNAGYGQIGSTDPMKVNGSMNDTPNNSLANFNGGFAIKEIILRFMSSPFCIDGDDAGKYLNFVVTWEDHTTATTGPSVSNIAVTPGQPSAEFMTAVANWIMAKMFTLPKAKANPCP